MLSSLLLSLSCSRAQLEQPNSWSSATLAPPTLEEGALSPICAHNIICPQYVPNMYPQYVPTICTHNLYPICTYDICPQYNLPTICTQYVPSICTHNLYPICTYDIYPQYKVYYIPTICIQYVPTMCNQYVPNMYPIYTQYVPTIWTYMKIMRFVAEMAILAKKNLRKKCVNRDKM